MDNDFILFDRIEKIRSVINKYGIDNFYIAFSGGKDSCVLSALIDFAFPNNFIPRVYANTGIDLNIVRDFVFHLKNNDNRIVILDPSLSIKQTLDTFGYPFKSKKHSKNVDIFQRLGKTQSVKTYLGECPTSNKLVVESLRFQCPDILRYQFKNDFALKISDKCCYFLKEEPMKNFSKLSNKPFPIIGIMAAEGGRRSKANCLSFNGKYFKAFQPLVPLTKDWEDWFISKYNIEICDIYKDPYNFVRTGCKGCPFSLNLEHELIILDKYFPNERKQAEYIWKPVYDEYKRLNYRLHDNYLNYQFSIDFDS